MRETDRQTGKRQTDRQTDREEGERGEGEGGEGAREGERYFGWKQLKIRSFWSGAASVLVAFVRFWLCCFCYMINMFHYILL